MFSVVWPLAPFVCLLHTMFRLRSNALRLTTTLSMRPVPEAVTGIGLWRMLLIFQIFVSILINCLIVSVSTDQLDYISCWTHSMWREEGACVPGAVPMSHRIIIAIGAEHVLLAVAFAIYTLVPAQQAAERVKLKRNAFVFKKRYWETIEAEHMMSGGATSGTSCSSSSTRLRSNSSTGGALAASLRPSTAIDYESAWRSGSDLSDAYDEPGEADSSPTPLRGGSVG